MFKYSTKLTRSRHTGYVCRTLQLLERGQDNRWGLARVALSRTARPPAALDSVRPRGRF
jgi:hypothetical protein